jgi:hypothetical protein
MRKETMVGGGRKNIRHGCLTWRKRMQRGAAGHAELMHGSMQPPYHSHTDNTSIFEYASLTECISPAILRPSSVSPRINAASVTVLRIKHRNLVWPVPPLCSPRITELTAASCALTTKKNIKKQFLKHPSLTEIARVCILAWAHYRIVIVIG